MEWSADVDRKQRRLVALICDRDASSTDRTAAWRRLMIEISPHVESWARRSRTLRRCRLAAEDDARAVLVKVLGRLAAHDYEALRAFLDKRPPTTADERERDEAGVLDRIVQLLAGGGDDDGEAADAARAGDDTPLRAWLLRVYDFAVKDHVRARLGQGEGSKRELGTDASRLDAAPEASARPPMTDLVTMRKVLEEVRGMIDTFPPEMRRAIALWAEDHGFDEIAAELALGCPERARELVRAATARLRACFRDRFPSLVAPA